MGLIYNVITPNTSATEVTQNVSMSQTGVATIKYDFSISFTNLHDQGIGVRQLRLSLLCHTRVKPRKRWSI